MIIAVDGRAASGKGTLARRLADHFGLAHLDTGALYRATALAVLRTGGDPADARTAAAAAARIRAGDLDDPAIRTDEVAQAASIVAALPQVRAALLDLQRSFARRPPGAVLDGRDIGTVICPDADAKLFVTASLEARAERRLKELREAGLAASHASVLREMRRRDARDSGRTIAPLEPAADAFLIDTSTLDADEAFAAALAFVRTHTGRSG